LPPRILFLWTSFALVEANSDTLNGSRW
jgi:hypothetical protein